MRIHTTWLAAAVAAFLLASGCSGGAGEDLGEGLGDGLGDGLGEGSAIDPPAVDLPGVVARPTDGELRLLGRVKGRDSSGYDGGLVFTDDRIVVVDGLRRITALDRETGDVAWTGRAPATGGDTVCPTPAPPPGATAVVVVTGPLCGLLTAYDLEGGRKVGTVKSEVGLGFLSTEGFARVGSWTYWVDADDNLRRIEPDGTSSTVAAASDLALGDGRSVQRITATPDGNQLVFKTYDELGDDLSQVEETFGVRDDGEFIGLDLEAAQEATTWVEAWRVPVKKALGRSVVPETTYLGTSYEQLFGTVVNTVRGGTARIAAFDPETGSLDDQLVLPADPVGGLPSWADDSTGERELLVADHQVYATTDNRGKDALARHDPAQGEIAWAWTPKRESPYDYEDVAVRPIAVSEEGTHVYASFTSFAACYVAELEVATGKQVRRWEVPDKVLSRMNNPQVYFSGDQVALYDPSFYGEVAKDFLVLLEIDG